MPPSISLLAGVSVLFYLFYKHIYYPLLLSPLSQIPFAHPTAPFSARWLKNLRQNGKTGIAQILAAHKEHGPLVRLSPTEISICSLDGLRKIYVGGLEKTQWYADELMNYGTPNLVSLLRSGPHSAQKRMLSHVYSKSYVQRSEDLKKSSIALVFENLLPVVRTAAEKGENFDAYGLNHAIGADFMSAYLFGAEHATSFIKDVQARQKFISTYRIKARDLPGSETATQEVEAFGMRMCDQAASATVSHPVVYAQLSAYLEKSGCTPEETKLKVASEMLDHFLASIETTRITLTYLQYQLSLNPLLQLQLRKELRTLSPSLKDMQRSSNSALPDPKSIDSLPILSAILKETLRLYPPSPALLPRLTPKDGVFIDSIYIPANIAVGTSAQCLHQNASVFPNPLVFRPERWLLSKDDENLKEMNSWFWAFGSGGRMCIGSHFAMYMLKLATVAIYTEFETSIVDAEGIEQEDAFLAGPVGEKLVLKFKVAA